MTGLGVTLWIYRVAIPSHRCMGLNLYDQRRFCRQLNARVQVHSVTEHEASYRVFSFSNAQVAGYFRDCFDGERYDGIVPSMGHWLDEFSAPPEATSA